MSGEGNEHGKIRIGVYALTSCYGCQLMFATVSRIMEIYDAVDIKSYHMLSSASSPHEKVDVAFVEGSVSTEKDLVELREIRKNSKKLVAMGACAINGGVQSWKGPEESYEDMFSSVYGDSHIMYIGMKAQPIEKFVEVDYRLPGCPPEEDEIEYFVSTFVFGTWPEERDYPVCHECRISGSPCILIENGAPCLGSVTLAGCGARCIKHGVPCIGCRGPVTHENAWFDSLAREFMEKGYDREYITERMAMFGSHDPTLMERLGKIFEGGEEDE